MAVFWVRPLRRGNYPVSFVGYPIIACGITLDGLFCGRFDEILRKVPLSDVQILFSVKHRIMYTTLYFAPRIPRTNARLYSDGSIYMVLCRLLGLLGRS